MVLVKVVVIAAAVSSRAAAAPKNIKEYMFGLDNVDKNSADYSKKMSLKLMQNNNRE